MSNFSGTQLTNAGRRVQALAQIGRPLVFTRVGLGDGAAPDGVAELAGLVSEKLSLDINSLEILNDGTSAIDVWATNSILENGFFMRELGVFARDPETETEVLYAYTHAGSESDFMPASGGATVVESWLRIITVIGTATNVTAVIDDTLLLATKYDTTWARNSVTLDQGQKVAYQGGSYTWRITNYDQFSNYTAHSLAGAVSLDDDLVTFDVDRSAQVGSHFFEISRNNTPNKFEIIVAARAIGRPHITSLNDGDIQVDVTPLLTCTPFVINPAGQDTHAATDWQIATDHDFENIVWKSMGNSRDLKKITATKLKTNTTHFVRVRHVGTVLGVGEWSPIVQFKTVDESVLAPKITRFALDVLETTKFATAPAGQDTHAATDWQIATDYDFENIIFNSLNSSENLTAHPLDELESLKNGSNYYARVRHHGTALGVSSWSSRRHYRYMGNMIQDITIFPWELIAEGVTEEFKTDQKMARSGNIALTLKGARLYKTSDGGQTWTNQLNVPNTSYGGSFPTSDIATDGAGVWIMVGAGGVATRSEDDGENWQLLPAGLIQESQGNNILTIATDGDGVWVAGFGGGYAARSVDNGQTWQPLPRYLGHLFADVPNSYTKITTIATDGDGVWVAGFGGGYAARSVDNGQTWQPLPRYLNSTKSLGDFKTICAAPGGTVIAAGSDGLASRSADGGATWVAIDSLATPAEHCCKLATDGAGVWLAVLYGGGVSYSTDDGLTWQNGQLTDTPDEKLTSVAVDQGRWLALSSFGHVYRAVSAAGPAVLSWTGPNWNPDSDPDKPGQAWMYAAAVLPNGNFLSVGESFQGYSGERPGALVSFDSGLNSNEWRQFGRLTEVDKVNFRGYGVAVDPGGHVYLAGPTKTTGETDGRQAVLKIDSNFKLTQSANSTLRGGVWCDIIVGPGGDIYAAGYGEANTNSTKPVVVKFNPTTLAAERASVLKSAALPFVSGAFNSYNGATGQTKHGGGFESIAAGPDGDVYTMCDANASLQPVSILRFDSELNYIANTSTKLAHRDSKGSCGALDVAPDGTVYATYRDTDDWMTVAKLSKSLNLIKSAKFAFDADRTHVNKIKKIKATDNFIYIVGEDTFKDKTHGFIFKLDHELNIISKAALSHNNPDSAYDNKTFDDIIVTESGIFIVGTDRHHTLGSYSGLFVTMDEDLSISEGALPNNPSLMWSVPNIVTNNAPAQLQALSLTMAAFTLPMTHDAHNITAPLLETSQPIRSEY